MMVILASNAQLEEFKAKQITENVFQLQPVMVQINIQVLLMLLAAMHAELANQDSLFPKIDQDVTDQDQLATASKDTHLMDSNAFSAQLDKLSTHKETLNVRMLPNVTDQTNILELVMLKTAMHAEPVNFHLSLLKTDKDVIDQDQLATVFNITVKMVTNASNAKVDKLLTHLTTRDVFQLLLVLDKILTLALVMPRTAMLAEPVNSHSSQLKIEQDVIDQDQLATVSRNTPTMDSLASNAQIDKLLIQLTTETVSQLHHALVLTNISELEMLKTALHAEHANFHSSQLKTDKAAIDQDQLAVASKDIPTMDSNAFNAHRDLLLIQETTKTVYQLHHALEPTNILDLLTNKTAMHAELANFHSSQLRIEPDAIDQDQFAVASKDIPMTDTLANNAQIDSLLTQETIETVFQLHHALVTINTLDLVMLRTAMLVELAKLHSFQLKTELAATDQDQLAHVPRDTAMMVTHALIVQTNKFKTETITNNVFRYLATYQTKSLVEERTVSDVMHAQVDNSQIHSEDLASDQRLLVVAHRDNHKINSAALNAKLDLLLTHKTQEAVSQLHAITPTELETISITKLEILLTLTNTVELGKDATQHSHVNQDT
jgi:hypothetical protein